MLCAARLAGSQRPQNQAGFCELDIAITHLREVLGDET